MMYRKGQQSRNDLLAWYGVCFLIVLISVGFLYGVGIIGDGQILTIPDNWLEYVLSEKH